MPIESPPEEKPRISDDSKQPLESIVESVVTTYEASVLTEEDHARAAALYDECKASECEEIWLPMHAGCPLCRGFIFASTSDVARQFGVCGCAIAIEMELAAAEGSKMTVALSQHALSAGVAATDEVVEVLQMATVSPQLAIKEPSSLRTNEHRRRQPERHARAPQPPLAKGQRVAAKMKRLGARGR